MTARVIRRRKLRGKFRIRDARRERAYKQAAELHAYEEWVVLRLLCKRNVGQVRQWLSDEPERWRKRPLLSTFRRLRQRRLIDGAGRLEHDRDDLLPDGQGTQLAGPPHN